MQANSINITYNKKVKYEYFLEEHFEAGIVLKGTEIKSIRNGKIQLKESFISIIDNEVYIKNMHISHYDKGNQFNHDETRERKLLLNRSEIKKLKVKSQVSGYTIVPVSLYIKNGIAKLDIAIAKGKKLYDKRMVEKERDIQKMLRQASKNY